ncbi:MAG: hypothetical protein GY752_07720 [bacterium]|nr:hypothetical protein [bacterium]MCP4799788.1 hypothetical protein [bacterium]
MQVITREEGQLIVSAVIVLAHVNDSPPSEPQVAELLNIPQEVVGLKVSALVECGIMLRVESAFENHLEVIDFNKLDELVPDESVADIKEDLAEFEERKKAEADKMSSLFDENDHERKKAERIKKMEESFFNMDDNKPDNPFGDK